MPPTTPRHPHPSQAVIRRRRALAVGSAAVVLAAVIGVAVALSTSGGHPKGSSPTTVHVAAAAHRCPLTDLRAPAGKVPNRPAVAVSIGNQAQGARPQSGLNEADIVYDTPAEGYVMRYVAVFQCHAPTMVGPDRSVRYVEWHLMQAFGHPILAFAGGITPDVNAVRQLGWLHGVDLLTAPQSVWTRTTSRQPPDNLYTSIPALLGLFPHDRSAPGPVFRYGGPLPQSATQAESLAINYSPGTDVLWKWDAAAGDWVHTYSGTTDVDALTNQPVTTTNVVVQIVHFHYGPYPESPGATGDVESQTVGTGPGYVLRGGKSIAVTWHRPTLDSATTFTDAAGKAVTLAPGRTFVEIVLDTTASTPGGLRITP